MFYSKNALALALPLPSPSRRPCPRPRPPIALALALPSPSPSRRPRPLVALALATALSSPSPSPSPSTDGRRLCRPLLTRAGHRTHDTHEGLLVKVAPGAGGAIPCRYGGHIGDRREGGSGCVFFVHALFLFYVEKCLKDNQTITPRCTPSKPGIARKLLPRGRSL